MTLITGPQLKLICPTLSIQRAELLAGLFNEICPKYGMDTRDEFKEFLANVAQESGEFSHKTENMNYRAERLAQVWPHRFSVTKTPPYIPNAKAKALHKKPVEIANEVYGGRMGNVNPNDGYENRGGGFIGLTGRFVYDAYTRFINKRDGTNRTRKEVAELVRSTDEWAMDSAVWFFCVMKGLLDEAVKDMWLVIVKEINGGYIGLSDRNRYMDRVNKILPE